MGPGRWPAWPGQHKPQWGDLALALCGLCPSSAKWQSSLWPLEGALSAQSSTEGDPPPLPPLLEGQELGPSPPTARAGHFPERPPPPPRLPLLSQEQDPWQSSPPLGAHTPPGSPSCKGPGQDGQLGPPSLPQSSLPRLFSLSPVSPAQTAEGRMRGPVLLYPPLTPPALPRTPHGLAPGAQRVPGCVLRLPLANTALGAQRDHQLGNCCLRELGIWSNTAHSAGSADLPTSTGAWPLGKAPRSRHSRRSGCTG